MKTVTWDRRREILRIRARIWQYLTPAAEFEPGLELDAAALLQLSEGDLRYLADLYFLLSPEVEAFDRDLPSLLRRLATTTVAEEERSAERVRGAIVWNKTIGARLTTGARNLYVTEPARRAFQTPENELLVAVLDAIVDASRVTGLARGSTGQGAQLAKRRDNAEGARRRRSLADVIRFPPTDRSRARVRSGRNRRAYASTLAAYDRWQQLTRDHEVLRDVIEQRALVTRDDPTLFEICCTFDVLDALTATGWQVPPLRLFGSPRALRVTATRGSEKLSIWYQHAPAGLSAGSPYGAVLQHHGLGRSALRPDLVLRYHSGTECRWIVCEMKLGTRRTAGSSVRAALFDLLAYRRAFEGELTRQAGPYGLGIAWGADLRPAPEAEVLLCTPDRVADGLEILFGRSPR